MLDSHKAIEYKLKKPSQQKKIPSPIHNERKIS